MRKFNFATLVALLAIIFTAGSINSASAQYDDLYFNPEDEVETTKATQESSDDEKYNYEDDYVSDYQYSSRIRRFRRPLRNSSYFTDYYVNSYYYDRFAPRTSIYTVSSWSAYNQILYTRPSRAYYGNSNFNPGSYANGGYWTNSTSSYYASSNSNIFNGYNSGSYNGYSSNYIANGCVPYNAGNPISTNLNNYYGGSTTTTAGTTPGLNSYYGGNTTTTNTRPSTNGPRRGTNSQPNTTVDNKPSRKNDGVRTTSGTKETRTSRATRTRRVDTNTRTIEPTKRSNTTRPTRTQPTKRSNTTRPTRTQPTKRSNTTRPTRSNNTRSTPTRTNRSSTRSSTKSSSTKSSSSRRGRN